MNLNQVTVPSLNVESSIHFYKTLGLKLIVKSLPNYARFVCPDGHSTFSIYLVNEPNPGDGICIYFECDQLEEKVKFLQTKNIEFEQLPTLQPWLWHEAKLKDPDGNQIILYFAGKNRTNPPWRIN